MKLRFEISQIEYYASRYSYAIDDSVVENLKEKVQYRGYLTKDELLILAKWKSPRSARHVLKNSEEYVKEITGFSFNTKCERAKIEVLVNLDGVNWPTASVILHFFDENPYPILDFRALWSLQVEEPYVYRFELWDQYISYCRDIAKKAGVSMRTLDRALWQYSKEFQN